MKTIRDLENADIEAVVRIATTAWEPVHRSYRELLGNTLCDTVFPDWKADKEYQIRDSIGRGSPVCFLVAELNGCVAGFVSYVIGPGKIGEIRNNAVDPSYQNKGIASSLYQEVQRRMENAGMKCAKVTTGLDPSHAPARRAYEKAGFSRAIPVTTYYKDL